MVADEQATGEAESREILQTRIQAWWLSVLAGQASGEHPVYGSGFEARMDGKTLVLSGSVPSGEDRRAIETEVAQLQHHGVEAVRDELQVVPEITDDPGLLVQTLVASFETAEQAGFAEGYMEGHAHVRPGMMTVTTPDETHAAVARVHAVLPEAYWEDAETALAAGRALLIVTVDETEAFKARELLDEETHSLETLVLPPQPARDLPKLQQEGLMYGA